jgi:hypothetical protein
MWGSCHFCNATIMYRADFLKSHLDLDTFINQHFSLQDWPAWVILAAYTDFDILPISTATFGIETVSITRPDTYERLEKRLTEDGKITKHLCELFPDVFPYHDDGGRYINSQLMNMAFRQKDFKAANKYAKLCGGTSIKCKCAKTRFAFYLFILLKETKLFVKKMIS